MLPFNLDNIDHGGFEELLEALVENKTHESRGLEFKLKLWEKQEDNEKENECRVEFVKDVTALANATGGDIIYGMAEDKGRASKVIGFGTPNMDAEIRRLTQIIQSQTEPALTNFHFYPVRVSDEKYALILRIPKSWISPHKVSLNNLFYYRHSNGVSEMDVWELRRAFLESNIESKIKLFRQERTELIAKCNVSNPVPMSLANGIKMVLHIIPWMAFAETRAYDICKRTITRNLFPLGGGINYSHPNIDGYITYCARQEAHYYAQLFRNGIIEDVVVTPQRNSAEPYINPGFVSDILDGVPRYFSIIQELNITPPFVIALSFLHTKGCRLLIGSQRDTEMPGGPLTINRLIIPEIVVHSLDQSFEEIFRPIFDMVWNAFGFDRCIFHYNGKWIGKEE